MWKLSINKDLSFQNKPTLEELQSEGVPENIAIDLLNGRTSNSEEEEPAACFGVCCSGTYGDTSYSLSDIG